MIKILPIPILLGLSAGCASLPANTNRPYSEALPPDPKTPLAQATETQIKGHPGQSGFYPLASGLEALVARMAAVVVSDRSIDLQYYIWENDLTGRMLLHEVLRAADRGVRVRVLLDDLNQSRYEKGLAILDYHPNVEVRMANPFAGRTWKILDAMRFSTVNRRMHNKVFVVDNQTAIVGGRNIGDEYFGASEEMNFGDFDLWAIGPVVQELSRHFDTYWNSEIAYPISVLVKGFKPTLEDLKKLKDDAAAAITEAEKTQYADALKETPIVKKFTHEPMKLYWGKADVVMDPPEKFHQDSKDQVDNLARQLYPLIEKTEKELILVSPYFVPGKRGVKFFKHLNDRGVQSLVLTNSLASSDVATVFSGYKGYRKDLLDQGVSLYELKPNSPTTTPKKNRVGSSFSSAGLHGKIFVFDRKKVFVGSMNLDPRSATLNSEMGVVVDSPELAEMISTNLIAHLRRDSYQVLLNEKNNLIWKTTDDRGLEHVFSKDPETSWWKRFKASLSAIFIPESWL
ncbi:Cardiolipin synthase C [Bdellovibrio bacteriovorus]|uniref:phospholipase D family protein n=1 Tax=Bdellovibrio bacteriovorus TaxID=959 RepID=UPI00045BED36|nr:phospholipase D family protein [Bdellovibrio bacteriovorus]AHZ86064.1 phospholipase D [Bdellovibrio bacteriovorus]BEV66989.1 Cardiolipin synthase C [Bdellovibrio bacteriovorus]